MAAIKTLYIHIGVPKTGSSAIQHFLDLNKNQLYSDGYIYKQLKVKNYDCSTRVESSSGEIQTIEELRFIPKYRNGFFLHGSADDPEEENLARLKSGLNILAEWFLDKPNIILTDESISRECFYWDFLNVIKDFTKTQGIAVKIILFLRKQDEYLDSFYRQRVKNRFTVDTWDDYLSKYSHSDETASNYQRIINKFSEPFGKENITVIPYEPMVWKRNECSIFSVFLDALNIHNHKPYKIPPKSVNDSTNYNQTEIIRILNRLVTADRPLKAQTKSFFKKSALACSELGREEKKYSYLSDAERKNLMEEYEKENDQIAEEYLGRESLFLSEFVSKEKWEYNPVEMQEEIILFFGYATKQLYEEIQYLKEHSFSLYALRIKLHRFKEKILSFRGF